MRTANRSSFVDRLRKTLLSLILLLVAGMAAGQPREIITYLHPDITGSPVMATDSAGNVVWKERYAPYGERQVKADDARNSLWFTGKDQDPTTGLSYFGARWYDPLIGRFTGVDPVSFVETNPQSFNRYTYANNNPYKFKDPDGRAPFLLLLVPALKAAATGGAIGFGTAFSADLVSQAAAFGADISFRGAAQEAVPMGVAGALGGGAAGGIATAIALRQVSREVANLPFRSGDVILREFQTSKGTLDVAAQAQVVDRTLHLKDIAIFPRGTEPLKLGTREVAALRNQLAQEARGLGFNELRITGTRISGANPGKQVDLTIDLTKLGQ
jgi:RHS repeat-associated protein